MSKANTQLFYAKQDKITKEMEFVANTEELDVNLIKNEIKRGRLIIPANINHKNLNPIGIGIAAKTKINANIGSSSIDNCIENEIIKTQTSIKYGADTIMDLSTGGNLDEIRKAVIAASSAPIGTVPMYQILHDLKDDILNLSVDKMLSTLEKQAKQGVSYFTIHCGFLLSHMPLVAKRKMGIVSRGGSLMASWMMHHHKENSLVEVR